jgi:hypothetical protein
MVFFYPAQAFEDQPLPLQIYNWKNKTFRDVVLVHFLVIHSAVFLQSFTWQLFCVLICCRHLAEIGLEKEC